MALQQIEGLITSVLSLMGLTISAPDHIMVSRRAVTLPAIQVPSAPLYMLIDCTDLQVYRGGPVARGQAWDQVAPEMAQAAHPAVNAVNGMTVARTLTDQDTDDLAQIAPLLDQIDNPIG